MEKQVVRANVPETGGPFNMAVTFGNMIYISGLPPFTEAYSRQMRDARAKGEKLPPYQPPAFEEECRIVMEHMKMLMEAAGSNMDCLLKVTVWLKDQSQQEIFDKSIAAISHRRKNCRRAPACRPGARRAIAASKSTRSATSPGNKPVSAGGRGR